MPEKLKLGIVGLSKGNGHPYSWAAIFNGYNKAHMRNCPFPIIYQYLSKQSYPEDFLDTAQVTHIWTQDIEMSKQIAKASRIPHSVDHLTELIGQVDGILLARDDAENHYRHVVPFLKAGLPVYIDKPLALSVRKAEKLFAIQEYEGQIYTCSALRYAKEIQLSEEEKHQLGKIKLIQAWTPKSWGKYAVHIIEPVLKQFNFSVLFNSAKILKARGVQGLSVVTKTGVLLQFFSLGKINHPISIRYIGKDNWKEKTFFDSFTAFKTALAAFIEQIHSGQNLIPEEETLQVIRLIESGIVG